MRHTRTRHITPHYATWCHIMSHYTTLRYITLRHITLCRITPHYATLHHIMPHYITLCHFMSHYATLRHIFFPFFKLYPLDISPVFPVPGMQQFHVWTHYTSACLEIFHVIKYTFVLIFAVSIAACTKSFSTWESPFSKYFVHVLIFWR
jgi:hypothetical protein